MEQVLMEIPARFEGGGGLGIAAGKLRLTSERLVFERRKLLGGAADVTSVPLATIQAASVSGVLEKKLKVRAGSTEMVFLPTIGSQDNSRLKSISDVLQRAIAGHPLTGSDEPAGAPAPDRSAKSNDWLDELERLAKLHTVGALTDEEFNQAKHKLLDHTV